MLADQILVTPVIRVDSYPGIAHHRLGARRGDRNGAAALDRVVEVVEMAVLFDVLHFEVGDGALVARTPVHDPRTTVDQPVLPEPDDDVADPLTVRPVHGEPAAR